VNSIRRSLFGRFSAARGSWWQVSLLIALALILRLLWIAFFTRGAAVESGAADYTAVAEKLVRSGLTQAAASDVPLLYPLILAGGWFFTQDFLSLAGTARLVSALVGALVVLPTFLIARLVYSRRVGMIAASIVATYPLLLDISSTALPDSTLLVLLLAATYCLLRTEVTRDVRLLVIAGALFGLAYLTHPESIYCLFLSVLALVVGARDSSRDAALRCGVVLLSAAAVAVPYTASTVVAGQHLQTAVMSGAPELGYLPHALSLVSHVGSPVLIGLAVLGLWNSTSGIAPQLMLVSTLIGAAIASSAVTIGLVPILLIWSSSGIDALSSWLRARVDSDDQRSSWVRVVVVVASISMTGVMCYRTVAEGGRASWLLWNTGWWLGRVSPVDKRIMDASALISFHANATPIEFPNVESETALKLIDDSAVDYVVVRSLPVGHPSYLREWLDRGIPDRRAQLVYSSVGRDAHRVDVYRWLTRADQSSPAEPVRDRADDTATTKDSVTGTNVSAKGPLSVNRVNPRYFSDGSGRAVYLTGAHTWANLQDGDRLEPLARFDFDRYLANLESHRLNFIRLWAWEQADWVPWRPYHFRIAPTPYVRVGPGLALDGKPQFDLTSFDEEYFRRLRQRVVAAGARNIYVGVMLFQGWSVDTKSRQWENPWNGHPYHRQNNVNGIDGDPDVTGRGLSIHTLRSGDISTLQKRYVEKIVNTVNDLDNVLYEICNECDGNSLEWQSDMVRFIHRLESNLPKQHPVGMTALWPGGRNADLFRSPADWVSPLVDDGYDNDPPAADGVKVIIADTDHVFGIGGDRRWVWKSFLRGLNPIFMDPDDYSWTLGPGSSAADTAGDARWSEVRRSMGYTAEFAARIDLASMRPRGDLCSPAFCLARVDGPSPEYLIYSPSGGRITIDLRSSPREMSVAWFDPKTGKTRTGDSVMGGAPVTVAAPFVGDAVVHLFTRIERTANDTQAVASVREERHEGGDSRRRDRFSVERRNPGKAKAAGRNRRPAHPLAHHENLWGPRHTRLRNLLWVSWSPNQGLLR
jgi:hypothetical protein